MKIDEDKLYYGMPLFAYHDSIITGNNLSVSQFVYGEKFGYSFGYEY